MEWERISFYITDIVQNFADDVRKVLGNGGKEHIWADNLPYYRNVRDEGVKLSA